MSINACACYDCGTILVSKHRHDFVECCCPQHTFTDGGPDDYIRRGGKDLTRIIDLNKEQYDQLTGKTSKKTRRVILEELYQKQLADPMSTANQCRPKQQYPIEIAHVYTFGKDHRYIVKREVINGDISKYATFELFIEKRGMDALGNDTWTTLHKIKLPNPADVECYIDPNIEHDQSKSHLIHLAAMLLYGKYDLLEDQMKGKPSV